MKSIMVSEIAQRLLTEVDKKGNEISKLHKALKVLASPEMLEAPPKVREACRQLELSNPGDIGLDIDLVGLLETTALDQAQRAKARRLEFGRDLNAGTEKQDLACRMLTSDPMEFALSPFTVSVDLDQNLATIKYARLPLKQVPAKPARIIAALQKSLKALDTGWSIEEFFDALYEAYRIKLFKNKAREGERVALIDLLAYVALSYQNPRFCSDPVVGNYRPYGRVHMAYDLAKLRRSGLLRRNGWRLNLGTATGASTRNKKGVLYIEEQPGQGQYYLSIWFSPTD